jgi:predicted DNA-binding ribbon-helix-helix protein
MVPIPRSSSSRLNCLREIAVERDVSLGALVAAIDANRQHANLSSAIRIFVLQFYRCRLR